jgi:riboflavin synthase
MFTGLVETICTVKSVLRAEAGAMRLGVDIGQLAGGTKIGDSLSINGVCLTVAGLDDGIAAFDVSRETLSKSNLGGLKASSQVNVERAMKASGRFGGHLVQGHIDGIATIKTIAKQGQFANMKFSANTELLEQMVVKGSVAVDGISLTIANMNKSSFGIAIIPKTLEKTTLSKAKIGDAVNIETDIIVKTVKRQLEQILPGQEKLTVEKLKEAGF